MPQLLTVVCMVVMVVTWAGCAHAEPPAGRIRAMGNNLVLQPPGDGGATLVYGSLVVSASTTSTANCSLGVSTGGTCLLGQVDVAALADKVNIAPMCNFTVEIDIRTDLHTDAPGGPLQASLLGGDGSVLATHHIGKITADSSVVLAAPCTSMYIQLEHTSGNDGIYLQVQVRKSFLSSAAPAQDVVQTLTPTGMAVFWMDAASDCVSTVPGFGPHFTNPTSCFNAIIEPLQTRSVNMRQCRFNITVNVRDDLDSSAATTDGVDFYLLSEDGEFAAAWSLASIPANTHFELTAPCSSKYIRAVHSGQDGAYVSMAVQKFFPNTIIEAVEQRITPRGLDKWWMDDCTEMGQPWASEPNTCIQSFTEPLP